MSEQNRQILLVSRPQGEATADNFKLVETPLAPLEPGQVLVRNHYLSLDPYMRGRMNDSEDRYAPPQPLNEVMIGGTVGRGGRVEESEVQGRRQGRRHGRLAGVRHLGRHAACKKVDETHVPLSAYLGAVGMPGVTGWYGLNQIIEPKAGETVVVSAASGAVGSVVGQLAKAAGCRAVGIAGGADKCRYVVETLGFDACVDYKAGNLNQGPARREDARTASTATSRTSAAKCSTPMLARMNAFGRIALCGMIAGYDGAPMPLKHPPLMLTQRLKVQGFIVSEHMDVWPRGARSELGTLVAHRKLQYPREPSRRACEAAPEAFLGLLKGSNFGKQLVKLI